jgi:hypothetical protein
MSSQNDKGEPVVTIRKSDLLTDSRECGYMLPGGIWITMSAYYRLSGELVELSRAEAVTATVERWFWGWEGILSNGRTAYRLDGQDSWRVDDFNVNGALSDDELSALDRAREQAISEF